MRWIALGSVIVTAGSAEMLADGAAPRPGLYRIEVRLELPNVLRPMPFRTVERCVSQSDGDPGAIVSAPNIEACPLTARSIEGGVLTFERACPKLNDGRASGRFELAEDGFAGRIVLTLGGKNMRLTELQTATRIGDCPRAPDP